MVEKFRAAVYAWRVMRIAISALVLFFASPMWAQTSAPVAFHLSSPLNYQVFQRQSKLSGTVVVDCQVETSARDVLTNLDSLEVRLLGPSTQGDLADTWLPLPFDGRVRRFRGELSAPAGGWYRLEARLMGHGSIVATSLVEHVGVGEVFVIAGQSNSANHGEPRQHPKSPLVVAFAKGVWQPADDPQPGASGTNGSFLPAFGDAMAERYQVPIGLAGIGVGSTSVREWLPKGDTMAAPPTTGRNTVYAGTNVWESTGGLFDKLVETQRLLGSRGFRAVLWHQGESDAHQGAGFEITPAQYREYLQKVIATSRTSAGWPVPWFVAQASYHSPEDQGSPEIRAAQKSLATDGVALEGPNTDELGPEYRSGGGRNVHFNARGLQHHGELWAERVGAWLEEQLAHGQP